VLPASAQEVVDDLLRRLDRAPGRIEAFYVVGSACVSAFRVGRSDLDFVAVGHFVDTQTEALAESWNGTSWSLLSPPLPAAATSSGLSGVSCDSARACTIVGYFGTSQRSAVALAEAWNGTAWSIESPLNPSFQSLFDGVSCNSPLACSAVGGFVSYDGSYGTALPLAELWDGTSWSVHNTPNPVQNDTILDSVSCTSATLCTAVGLYTTNNSATLAEVWNGKNWSIRSTPTGESSRLFSGVSCPSASVCFAVGYVVNSAGVLKPLAERQ
jgi:hypothetical protein